MTEPVVPPATPPVEPPAPVTPPAVPPTDPPAAPPVTPPAPPADPNAAPPNPAPAPPAPVQPPEVTLKAPENSKLSQADIADVQNLAKTLGLTQPQAQAMLENKSKTLDAFMANTATEFQKVQETWKVAAMSDPELGGDAATFAGKMEHVKLGLKDLVNPAELAELEKNGFGNMPFLLRAGLRYYNNVLKNPNFVEGRPPLAKVQNTEDARAARMFPSTAGK